MIIKNPTEKEISIIFKGKQFKINSGESISASEDLAVFWKRIHGFIIISGEDKTEEEMKKVIEEQVKEVPEQEEAHDIENAEEVKVEEKPKIKVKKSK